MIQDKFVLNWCFEGGLLLFRMICVHVVDCIVTNYCGCNEEFDQIDIQHYFVNLTLVSSCLIPKFAVYFNMYHAEAIRLSDLGENDAKTIDLQFVR